MKIGADNLPDDPVLLKQMLLLAQGKVAQLQEQVALLRHKLFSPKSERSPEDADSPQLAMFNEVEELIEAAAAPSEAEAEESARGCRLSDGDAGNVLPLGKDGGGFLSCHGSLTGSGPWSVITGRRTPGR
ncbi:transposase [Ectopseudomonas oleovorans]|uniref:transposase n=1 Tax=Ectopseudomonas oleovorans TaxID=301 RepID=UPI0036F40093